MARGLTTAGAARQIGVTPGVLLQWERRFGWPSPVRCANGHRSYSKTEVDALVQVPAWRDSGIPLRQALERAQKLAASVDASVPGLSVDYLVQTVDQLDMHLVITRAPEFTIEFANAKQQSVYPGKRLVGRPAPDVLTHSVGYIDTAGVLRHVASTGEAVRIAEQRVPIGGEGRWWTVTYSRLDPGSFDDVRVMITAVDDTRHVLERDRVQALANQAGHEVGATDERGRAVAAMAAVADLLREEPGTPLKRLLTLIRNGLGLDAAAVFVTRSGALRCAEVAAEEAEASLVRQPRFARSVDQFLARLGGPIGTFPELKSRSTAHADRKAIVVPFDASRTSALVLVVPRGDQLVQVRVEMAEFLCDVLGGHEWKKVTAGKRAS